MENIEEKANEHSLDEEASNKQKKKRNKSEKKRNRRDKRRKGSASDSNFSVNSQEEKEEKEKREQKIKQDFIQENFVLLTEIGKGAFGQIFLTYSTRDNEEVATKKEIRKSMVTAPQLKMEFIVIKTLLHIQNTNPVAGVGGVPPQDYQMDFSGAQRIPQEDVLGVPKFFGYGENMDYYYLIVQLLGPNLIELFNYCNAKKFTVGTVCMLAIQMLNRIEYMHKHHYLHRDIKPENFLIGCGDKSNVIYLIDFGLSKKYKDPKTHQHIPYRENRALTGTARYVSINTHLGIEQSRRDDLESIGYVLVYFLKGALPWQGLKNNQDKYAKIMEKKLQIPTEILCFGLPDEITYYLNYCKSLRFEDRPDYDYLRGLFVKLLYNCVAQYSLSREQLKFDWCFDDLTGLWSVYNKRKLLNQKKEEEINISNITPARKEDNQMVINNISNITPIPEEEENIMINKNNKENNNNIKNSSPIRKSSTLSNHNLLLNMEEIKENTPGANEDMASENEIENTKNNNNNNQKTPNDDKNYNHNHKEDNNKLTESEGTVALADNFYEENNSSININLENNDFKEIFESKTVEDIDDYIDNIGNRFNKAKIMRLNTNTKQALDEQNTENTVHNNMSNINSNIILEDILQEDSENSIRNFIANTKKLQKRQTANKKQNKAGESLGMQSESQDFRTKSQKQPVGAAKEQAFNKKSFMKTYTLENPNDLKNNNKNQYQNKINVFENSNKNKNIEKDKNKHIKSNFTIGEDEEIKLKENSNENRNSNNNLHETIGTDPKFPTNTTGNANLFDPKFHTGQPGKVNLENLNISSHLQIGLKEKENEKNTGSQITLESKNIISNPLNNLTSNSAQNQNNKKFYNLANDNSNNNSNNNKNKEQAKLNTGNYENQILQSINSSEMKDKRKSKILELNSQQNQNSNSNSASMRLSKDQMIKISNEPIQKYYNIISDLGHGSYGMVKKVKHKHIGEERAMKIVRKKLDSQNEIDILKKISHPNIISIYEIFEDSKNYYIMSELLEGGELFEEITRSGSFSEFEAANIMKQILSAVNYMHNKLIVHRDLKPENIMLISKANTKFEIKLIDFGTAKLYEKGVKLSKFIGTSYYIAPEVLSESYDEKCDVWSCGVILYILLCGYPPFNGASNLDIYHAIKYSPPNFSGDEWKEVSREAIDLIKIMLNKSPQKRFSAEQCMQHKWFSILALAEERQENKEQAAKPKFNQLKAISRMSNFVMENRLKQSVLQFISSQFNLKEEERSLRQLFLQFDYEKKGYITYASFFQVLSKHFGENESKLICDKMFENLDLDGSGEISYNEFITAIIDNKSMVTNERLDKTFKMFDKDNSGKISLDEIRNVFGGDKEKWRKIIRDIDLDGDGEIDIVEFKAMMGSIEENELK